LNGGHAGLHPKKRKAQGRKAGPRWSKKKRKKKAGEDLFGDEVLGGAAQLKGTRRSTSLSEGWGRVILKEGLGGREKTRGFVPDRGPEIERNRLNNAGNVGSFVQEFEEENGRHLDLFPGAGKSG